MRRRVRRKDPTYRYKVAAAVWLSILIAGGVGFYVVSIWMQDRQIAAEAAPPDQ